jgi:hypothetical protein
MSTSERDDRVLPVTRWVAILVVPILVLAFIILYGLPDRTTDYFAWTTGVGNKRTIWGNLLNFG